MLDADFSFDNEAEYRYFMSILVMITLVICYNRLYEASRILNEETFNKCHVHTYVNYKIIVVLQ